MRVNFGNLTFQRCITRISKLSEQDVEREMSWTLCI